MSYQIPVMRISWTKEKSERNGTMNRMMLTFLGLCRRKPQLSQVCAPIAEKFTCLLLDFCQCIMAHWLGIWWTCFRVNSIKSAHTSLRCFKHFTCGRTGQWSSSSFVKHTITDEGWLVEVRMASWKYLPSNYSLDNKNMINE